MRRLDQLLEEEETSQPTHSLDFAYLLCDPLFECWFGLTSSCDCASNWRNFLSSRAFSMRRGPTVPSVFPMGWLPALCPPGSRLKEAEGSDVVIVAGGLGLSPLRPAIYKILANRRRYGRVVILFGSGNPKEMLYRHDSSSGAQRLDVDIEVTVDHADPDWRGNVSVVPKLIPKAAFDPHDAMALICGPEVMMRFS